MKSLTNIIVMLLSLLPALAWADGTEQEAKEQNTPEGWNAVQLPQLPAIGREGGRLKGVESLQELTL